jgi:KDO2-lipid IV(A) lauroyltransferase
VVEPRKRDRIAGAALGALGGVLERMPLARSQGLARGLARAYVAARGRRVRWAQQNLRIAYPDWSEAARRDLAQQSCANVLLALLDLYRSEKWSPPEILTRFSFEGVEHLAAVLRRGRGAVLLSLHMGTYDLGLRALALRFPALGIAAISKPQKSPVLESWLHRRRDADAIEVIAPGRGAGLRALRVLRAGRPLILLNDLYARRGRRVQVPLFGKLCETSTGPAVLARSSLAPILPCYVVRDAADHHTLRILPELELPDPSADDAERTITALCNAALEGIIRKHPEQWTWGHRRFRYSKDLPRGLYRPRSSAGS